MFLAFSQMFFDSCQKELKKMKLSLPGNCLIFISLNADFLRQGQKSPQGDCDRGLWERAELALTQGNENPCACDMLHTW